MAFADKGIGLALLKVVNEGIGFATGLALARVFGAGADADALFAAMFVGVYFARELSRLVRVALVPCLVEEEERDGLSDFEPTFALALAGGSLLLAALALACAPWIVRVLAPGFDADRAAQASRLLRVLAPGLCVYMWFGAIQARFHVRRHFYLPEIADLAWKAAGLSVLLIWGQRHGVAAYALALTGGSFLSLGILLAARHAGGFGPPARTAALRRFRPAVLRSFGLGVFVVFCSVMLRQMEQAVDRAVISFMEAGTLTVFSLSARLVQVAPFLLAASFIMPFLPEVSRARARGRDVRRMTKQLTFFLVLLGAPLGLLLLWGARDLVELLLLRGKFDRASAETAILAVRAFALGVPPMFFVQGLAGMFLIERNTREVVRSGVLSILVHLAGNMLLFRFGVPGVALAGSATFWISAAYLWTRARSRSSEALVFSPARFALGLAAACAALFAVPWRHLVPMLIPRVMAGGLLCAAVYGALVWPLLRRVKAAISPRTAHRLRADEVVAETMESAALSKE